MTTNRKPLQKYNPGSLDESDLESLKMGVTEELWDISTNFMQTDEILGDVFEKTQTLEIDRDKTNAKIEEYWHLSVEGDQALAERISNMSADMDTEHGYLSSQITETNRVVSDLQKTTAENKLELESSISSVQGQAKDELAAAEQALADAIARGDEAEAERLRKEIERLMGIIDANKADIEAKLSITNTTIAELDKAMAENKLEMEASIKESSSSVADQAQKDLAAAQAALDKAIADGDAAEAERLRKEIDRLLGIIDANQKEINAKLAITNQTIAELDKAVAMNKTELEASIKGVSDTSSSQNQAAIDKAAKDLADAQAALDKAIAEGDKEAAEKLQAEIDRLMGIINGNKADIEAKLTITNTTVAELNKALSENKTELSSKIENVSISVSNSNKQLTDKIDLDISNLGKAVDNKLGDVVHNFSNDLLATDSKLSNALNGTKEELEQSLADAQAALDKAIADGDTVLADYILEAQAALEAELRNEILSTDSKLTGALSGTKSELEKSLADAQEALDAAIAAGDTNLAGLITDAKAQLEAELAAKEKALRAEILATDNKLTGALSGTTDELKASLAAAEAALNKAIADGDEDLAQFIKDAQELLEAELRADILATDNKLSGALSGTKTELEQALVAAQAALDKAIADGDDELAKFIKDAQDQLQAKIDAQGAELNTKIANTDNKLSNALTGTKAELDQALLDAQKALNAAIAAGDSDLIKQITAAQDALLKEMASRDTALDNKLTNAFGERIDDVNKSLTVKINGVEQIVTGVKGQVDKIESDLVITNTTMSELTKTVSQNKTELSSKIEGVDAKLTTLGGTVDVKVGKLESDMVITNQTLTDLTSTVASHKMELTSKIEDVAGDVQGAADAALDQARKELATAQAALNKAITDGDAAEAEKLMKEVNKLMESIKNTKDEINATLTNNYVTSTTMTEAISSASTSLSTEFGGKLSTVNQTLTSHTNSLGQMENKWGVHMEADGKISGVSMNNNGKFANFEVRADVFSFANKHGHGIYSDGSTTRMQNVVITENCTVLGTLYADRVVGLPEGKSFGVPETRDLAYETVTVFSTSVASGVGRFNTRCMLGGLPQIYGRGGSANAVVEVWMNGSKAFESPIITAGSSWADVPQVVGRPIWVGSGGGTLEIRVRVAGNGSLRFRMHEGFIYQAIDR